MKFTVITICLNMEEEIGRTISSVLNQTYTDFEYIIKDGVSNDKSVPIAESFAPAFAEKGISFRVISTPDKGIYDAMNQAVLASKGEWLIFMNAGDCFAGEMVLEKVVNSTLLESADVVYGDGILKNKNLLFYQKALNLETMRIGTPFFHQSTFNNRELFRNTLYSQRYPIAGDFHFYLTLFREGKQFAYYPDAISIFDTSGISSNVIPATKDSLRVVQEMPERDEEAIQRLCVLLKRKERAEFLHQHFWKYIPEKVRMKRWEWKRRKAGWKTEEEFFGTKKDNT